MEQTREIMGNGETIENQWETIWKTNGREVGDKRHKSETIQTQLQKQWRENRETIERQLGARFQGSSGRHSGRQLGDS